MSEVTEKVHNLNNLVPPQFCSGSSIRAISPLSAQFAQQRCSGEPGSSCEREKGESYSANVVLVSILVVPARLFSNSEGARADKGGCR